MRVLNITKLILVSILIRGMFPLRRFFALKIQTMHQHHICDIMYRFNERFSFSLYRTISV